MTARRRASGYDIRYPGVKVQLTGRNGPGGNAFAIIGTVTGALRTAKVPKERIDEFVAEATSSGYDNVIATAMRWVDVR